MTDLYNFENIHNKPQPLISDEVWSVCCEHWDTLNNMIDHERDFLIDYFGFKTLERAYLIRINKKCVERPQHMWLRVSIAIHGNNIEKVKETYDLMSQKYFTHATPTLYNAGTRKQQLSSCYLLGMEDDSIDGIYNTLKDTALISNWQVESVFIFIIFVHLVVKFMELMERVTALFQCLKYLTIPPDM